MLTQNRFHLHYEHIVRPHLLLKSNYANTMEVARLSKLIIVSRVPHESVKQMMLLVEALCGQRLVATRLYASSTRAKGKARTRRIFNRLAHIRATVLRCCLRDEKMYHFIEKMITVLGFHNYVVIFQDNTIQLQLHVRLLRLFPEIENYVESNLQNVRIIIVTSAKTRTETRLLWTGLFKHEHKLYG